MVHLNNAWDEKLAPTFAAPSYLALRQFLKEEYTHRIIYPKAENIFNAIKTVDYDKVSVVILGQDPYHEPGQAHGFAFSVQPGTAVPPSLCNIFEELKNDCGCFIPDNGCLLPWAEQGVLLLNTVLTVRKGEANSHRDRGWEAVTDRIIELLNERESPVVFLLWGAPAGRKAALVTNPRHLVLTAPHPSPLSAYRGFFGCRHFSKANEFLIRNGRRPVDWQIPNLRDSNKETML